MRKVILLGAIVIAQAINPAAEMSDTESVFVAVAFAVSILTDLVDFALTKHKGWGG